MNPYHDNHERLDAPTSKRPQRSQATAADGQQAIGQTQAPEDDDIEYAARQLRGLVVLLTFAESETAIVPFSGPIVQQHCTGTPERVDPQLPLESAKQEEKTGRGAAMWRFVRTDPMLRSALFLIVNSGVSAGLGFAFWIITARLFSTESVGLASSLTSASNLIMFLGLVGMNTTFVRYLPLAKNRDRLITAGVSLVMVGSGALAVVCVVLLPLISRPLSFVAHSLPLAVGFVLLTAVAGVNLLADSVFIAAGKSQYNILIDGVIGGGTKIILLLVLAGAGAYGVFGASSGGFVTAAVASLFLMIKVLHWRPKFTNFSQVLKPVLSFSGTSYAGSVLALLPMLVVPLIILDRLGASSEAYYYVSYQLATLLYAAVYSVEQSFLSEGAGADVLSGAVLMRSIRILAALCIPAFVLIVLFGHQLLAAFGPKYANHTGNLIIVLAVAVFPIAAANWCMTVLRLVSNKLGAIVWASVVGDVIIIGLAWVWAPHGLEAVAMAWPLGCTAALLVLVVPAVKALRRSRSTRHHHTT
jgi:O-antigen/teichoic acid export membrane protein